MLACFRACPQHFFNEFVLGLRPAEVSIDLHAGGAFAHAREAFAKRFYLAGETQESARTHAYSEFLRFWGDVAAPFKSPKTQANIWLAFDTYLETYPPATDHVQPYFLNGFPTFEFSIAEPLDDPAFPRHPESLEPFIYAGRFDQLGTYYDKPVILDDKTTKAAGEKWAEQWSLRSQFIGYVWACQRQGLPIDTVVIRGVVVQVTSIRIIEAIKTFAPHLIALWYEQLRRDLDRLVIMWRNFDHLRSTNHPAPQTAWDYNLSDSCTSYGGCIFRDVCGSRPELHGSWMNSYKVRHWNPLLKDPIDSKAVYDAHTLAGQSGIPLSIT
jgi:hypothetical protein